MHFLQIVPSKCKRPVFILILFTTITFIYQAFPENNSDSARAKIEPWKNNSGKVQTIIEPVNLSRLENVLIYCRIHKTGSTTFQQVLISMARRNKFIARKEDIVDESFKKTEEEQVSFMRGLIGPPYPKSVSGHIRFFDFGKIERSNPMWISLVRNVVDREKSEYYYRRSLDPTKYEFLKRWISERGQDWYEAWKTMSLEDCIRQNITECIRIKHSPRAINSVMFFCGYSSRCGEHQSSWALEQAIENVERWFPVVGVVEEMNATLEVLEHKLPKFFTGAKQVYYYYLNEPHWNSQDLEKRMLSKESRSKFEENLSMEIQFYDFLRARLLNQWKSIHTVSKKQ